MIVFVFASTILFAQQKDSALVKPTEVKEDINPLKKRKFVEIDKNVYAINFWFHKDYSNVWLYQFLKHPIHHLINLGNQQYNNLSPTSIMQ